MHHGAESYYLDNAVRILASFEKETRPFVEAATSEAENDLRAAAAERARDMVGLLLPEIPYIGGKSNRLTLNLVVSV
jgi:hypothetical protein